MCQAAKKYTEAETLIQQTLHEVRAAGGNGHPEVARGLGRLAGLYVLTGRKEQATRLYEEAAEVMRRAAGEDHPDHAAARQVLALHYRENGAFDRAVEAFERSLSIVRRTFGAQHPSVALGLQHLAETERQRRNPAAAERHYRAALEGVQQAEVPLDAFHATLLHGLAAALRAQGQPRQVEELLRAALDMDQTSNGEETPGHLATLHDLAGLCAATEQEAEALRLWSRALEAQARLLPAYGCMRPGLLHEGFLSQTRTLVDCLLTLALRHPEQGGRPALEAVLRWKDVTVATLAAQDKETLTRRHPELRKELERRFYLGRQTAARGWFGVGPEGMDTHRKLLAGWQQQRERIEEDLAGRVPEFARLRQWRAATVESVAAQMLEGEMRIEYVRYIPKEFTVGEIKDAGAARYLALLLSAGAGHVMLFDLGPAEAIRRLVRQATGWWPFGRGRKRAALRATLFGPLAAVLAGVQGLMIAPDEELARVDFARLPDERGQMLGERFRMHQVASTSQ
jgi:tetratricopeptide (TPR) repeat protein